MKTCGRRTVFSYFIISSCGFSQPVLAQNNEAQFWKHIATHSAIYGQSTSGTSSHAESDYKVSSQNIILDTYTFGKLGNSTYLSFFEAITGKLNGTVNGEPKSPYGNDLLQFRGSFVQQWQITNNFSLGWNYYGLNRNIRRTREGKFGYRLDALGLAATFRLGDWTFMPQADYVFNGDLGKDGMFGLGSANFEGFYVLPVIKRKLTDHGAYLTLLPEYFQASGENGTKAQYMKWQLRLSVPLSRDKKWRINGRIEHQDHNSFVYQGMDISPEYDTTVAAGIEYNW